MKKKTKYVIVIEIILCLNPLWISHCKVVWRRKRWYNGTWDGTCRPNHVQPPWLFLFLYLWLWIMMELVCVRYAHYIIIFMY